MAVKVMLLVVLAIPAFAVAYYFAVALPAHNKAVLDFEQQKYRDAQDEGKAKQAEAAKRALELRVCLGEADDQYYLDVKHNGSKNADGGYGVDARVLSGIEHKKQNAVAECQKRFGY